MWLRSDLWIERSPVEAAKPGYKIQLDEADECAEEIAEAHKSIRFLARYTTPERRAKLEEALRAIEDIDSVVEEIQRETRQPDYVGGYL